MTRWATWIGFDLLLDGTSRAARGRRGIGRVVGELGKMLREPGESLARVFRNQGLRRLNLAFAGSIVGDWAFSVGIGLYAFQKGGPTVLGVVGVVRYITMAAIGPLMSSLGDRYSRKLVYGLLGPCSWRHRRHSCRDRGDRRARFVGLCARDDERSRRHGIPTCSSIPSTGAGPRSR